jgi:hypothetical protein
MRADDLLGHDRKHPRFFVLSPSHRGFHNGRRRDLGRGVHPDLISPVADDVSPPSSDVASALDL